MVSGAVKQVSNCQTQTAPGALAAWGLPEPDLIASNVRTEGAIQMDIGQSDCCWLVSKDLERDFLCGCAGIAAQA